MKKNAEALQVYHDSGVERTSNIYILFIQVKGWKKSTNSALPQGSVELNARQNEKVKNLKRREKEENRRPRSLSRGLYNGTINTQNAMRMIDTDDNDDRNNNKK